MRRPPPAAVLFVAAACWAPAAAAGPAGGDAGAGPLAALLNDSCLDCHAAGDPAGGLDLAALDLRTAGADPGAAVVWENVLRRVRTGQMPPAEMPRPDAALSAAALRHLENALDRAAAGRPEPGRTASLRRLTRAEYRNAVRAVTGLEIDPDRWLPKDESSHGFDNVTVGDLSPTRMDRYVSAATAIARTALGRVGLEPGGPPEATTVRVRPDLTQDRHLPGLPLGTRGGVLVPHTFPRAGEYEVRVRLMRDRNEHVEGLREPHTLDVLLDAAAVGMFTVEPPRGSKKPGGGWIEPSHADVDRHLVARFRAAAGRREIGVAFHARSPSLLETARRPGPAHFNFYRHPRLGPAVYEVTVAGPLDAAPAGPGASPTRDRILVSVPPDGAGPDASEARARRVLAPLLRRAYRRPIAEADFTGPLDLFREGSADGGFGAGVELALAGVLVSPHFLFRVERDPPHAAPGDVYEVSDVELASRLSFFLWAGPPDEELLGLAERGELSEPAALERQVRRMLADGRAESLATIFAGQWLRLRNLDGAEPDMRRFPDFDDNLRRALRRETELLFTEVVAEDRPVTALLDPGHAWLNDRLAEHYGVPHVVGSRFRRVDLNSADDRRGGLLRQGSLLTVTSYATRTSPVLRGTWVLDDLLGTPVPPPPPDVPALDDNTVAAGLSVRDRLAAHRAHAACAVCHDRIDPVGFAFEEYDAVGRRRAYENGGPVRPGDPVDASGAFPGGAALDGVADLEAALTARPDLLATTLAEKLLTYALGRGLDHRDAPAIRSAVRRAAEDEYRFSALVLGVVDSPPFRQRTAR